ncbi:NlpC/P60 family protein [Yersinia pestis]|uniref:NlpC/P60 family protein n=1 Tax=Yersinia pestis TaxID=632 RepID=UPI000D57197A|nr:NlpC/P60 family protein [Yersinia pestis]KAA5817071.1 endopeptidase [Yersinia pestis]PVF62326.1 endopeptidase [Yersinia pestis]QFR85124.1 endopeptidase [Yersinia pestis subsp. pestis bv. Medievalis]QPA87733.1 C40 family peptidase [Yersinia pestis]TNV51389.1 endopeptidase [Yersinia pestis]
MRTRFWIFLISMVLAGCSSHTPTPSGYLSDSIVVVAKLNEKLRQWEGTPYRNGGLDQRGVDCSGFVYRTFRDRFDMQLPRTTLAQTTLGTKVSRDELMPGDLVFFKTGSGQNGLHVGIYDTNDEFIHASTSKGVIRSSLENVYWKRVYWQARRI